MMTRCYCEAFNPFDPRMGKRFPTPIPLQAQAADERELTSKQQLREIHKIVSQLADYKTKQETISRLADSKTKQVAAAITEATALVEEGSGSAVEGSSSAAATVTAAEGSGSAAEGSSSAAATVTAAEASTEPAAARGSGADN